MFRRGSDEIDCDVTYDGHVVGAVSPAQAGPIVGENDIEHPLQAVLDGPLARAAWAVRVAVSGAEET